MSSRRVLVITAVPAEADAVQRGLSHKDIDVVAGGVGPAAAAAGTARQLTRAELGGQPYALVVSAGIAGGFVGRADIGAIVVASRSIAADLGSQSPDGFLTLDELGFGTSTVDARPPDLSAYLASAIVGDVLTVSTVTGTAARAAELAARHPAAVAEAMEGYGVGIAASQAGAAFAEIRTIANPVGPRDRGAWRIGDALNALTTAAAAIDAVARELTSSG